MLTLLAQWLVVWCAVAVLGVVLWAMLFGKEGE